MMSGESLRESTDQQIYNLASKLQGDLGDHNSIFQEFIAIRSVLRETYQAGYAAGAAAMKERAAQIANNYDEAYIAKVIRSLEL